MMASSSWLQACSELARVTPCPLWLSCFLRTLIKRRRHNLRSHALPAYLYFHRRAQGRELQRHVGQRNVLLEERRGRPAGDVSDFATAAVEHLVSISRDATLNHLQTNQSPRHTFGLRFFQRGAADELRLLHLAEAVEASLPDINRIGNLVPVKRQFAFKAQSVARSQSAWDKVKFFAGD